MGIDDRDYEYRPRGQAERRRGPYAGSDAPAGRSYQRGRGYDDPRSSSGSRYDRGGGDRGGDRGGYDRRPRSDQSSGGRRPRPEWDDDATMRRDRRPPADGYARGDRSGRGPRPQRDDWETSARARGAPRGPSPADSGGRNRRPGAAGAPARGGGGIWGDQPLNGPGGRRAGFDPRDPRARRGAQVEEEEESSGAAAFGKALMAIFMALLIGVGAAYGYYVYSTPKIPASATQPSASPASGSGGSSQAPAGLTVRQSRPALGLSEAGPTVAFVFAPAAPRA